MAIRCENIHKICRVLKFYLKRFSLFIQFFFEDTTLEIGKFYIVRRKLFINQNYIEQYKFN